MRRLSVCTSTRMNGQHTFRPAPKKGRLGQSHEMLVKELDPWGILQKEKGPLAARRLLK